MNDPYSRYNLWKILDQYKQADEEYEELRNEYTGPGNANPENVPDKTLKEDPYYDDAECPIDVDWAALLAQNSDVVGWIYVESLPEISYPILHYTDNDFYLHRDINKEYLYAGSIFVDWECAGDFSDPNTIIYNHNMKNGSMFNHIKQLKVQEKYDEAPYIWILVPDKHEVSDGTVIYTTITYRYIIYRVFDTSPPHT